MKASFEMTTGKQNLDNIVRSFPLESPYWNEAQNRFQFIDRLLKECLGWEQPYIEVEATDDLKGKADYLLGKPAKAVLEAKKEAKKFDFLPGVRPNAARKLRPLIDGCHTLNDAVRQVILYCAMHGAPIAVVCNEPQMVIFQTYIPEMSPFDSECYVFNGFQGYITNFPLLWKLLSPEGVMENRPWGSCILP